MLRASPRDPDMLIAHDELVASTAVWQTENEVTAISQSVGMQANELVYQTL